MNQSQYPMQQPPMPPQMPSPMPPMLPPPHHRTLLWVIIIILAAVVLFLGYAYYLGSRESGYSTPQASGTPAATAAGDAQLEKDLQATDVNNLDTELNSIDAQLK